jgi:hypothetical protein
MHHPAQDISILVVARFAHHDEEIQQSFAAKSFAEFGLFCVLYCDHAAEKRLTEKGARFEETM